MRLKYRSTKYHETTAKFATRYPHWHPFRGDPTSNYRRLLDPIMGSLVKEQSGYIDLYSSESFLSTTSLFHPDTLYTTNAELEDRLPDATNLIQNSDFSSTVGDESSRWYADTSPYEQYIDIEVSKNAPLYINIYSESITLATIHYTNLETGATGTDIVSVFNSPVSLQKSYAVRIDKVRLDGDNTASKTALWIGDENSPWMRHEDDTVYWLENSIPALHRLVGDGHPVYEGADLYDIFTRTSPTRASVNTTPISSDTLLDSARVSFEDKIEFHGDAYSSIFDAHLGSIRRTVDRSTEYFYTLKEINTVGDLIELPDEIVAIHLTEDAIIALSRVGTSSSSSSSSSLGASSSSSAMTYSYSLLYVCPDYSNPDDSILNVIKRIPLGYISEFDNNDILLYSKVEDLYSLVATVSSDSGTSYYEIELNYDYYYYDSSANQYVFRHQYDSLEGAKYTDFVYSPYFGPLDEHGLLRGLPRLKEESNYTYKNRLIDYSSIFKTNSSSIGLRNAINLRLGFQISRDVIVFDDNLEVIIADEILYIVDNEDEITESLTLDSNYNQVELANMPYKINSVKVNDVIWPFGLYGNEAGSNIITFKEYPPITASDTISVSYLKYTKIYDLTTYNLSQLFQLLETDGYIVSTEYSLTALAELEAQNLINIIESGYDISLTYYPATIKPLDYSALSEFQDLSIERFDLDKLQRIAIDLRDQMRDTWDRQRLDIDRWDMVPLNLIGGGLLPAYHDGLFSWKKDEDGGLSGHVDEVADTVKEGFELHDLQTGTNMSKTPLERYNDLKTNSISSNYVPLVEPGYFYIKEMQFYLYANKNKIDLEELLVYKVDLDALRAANPFTVFDTFQGYTDYWNGDEVYVSYTELSSSSSSSGTFPARYVGGYNTKTGVTDYVDLELFLESGTEYYFLTNYANKGPVVLTSSMNRELQYSVQPSGLFTMLEASAAAGLSSSSALSSSSSSVGGASETLMVEYEMDTADGLSPLDVSVLNKRGFLYISLTDTFSESMVDNNNIALINGPGKGRMREVYDPDLTLNSGIDLNPGQVIDTQTWETIAEPSGPATVANANLYVDGAGYGAKYSENYSR